MPPKIGRPKLDVTRTVLIGARFTPAEARQIEQAVGRSGKVKSEWLRQVLLVAAELGDTDQKPPSAGSISFAQPDAGFLD